MEIESLAPILRVYVCLIAALIDRHAFFEPATPEPFSIAGTECLYGLGNNDTQHFAILNTDLASGMNVVLPANSGRERNSALAGNGSGIHVMSIYPIITLSNLYYTRGFAFPHIESHGAMIANCDSFEVSENCNIVQKEGRTAMEPLLIPGRFKLPNLREGSQIFQLSHRHHGVHVHGANWRDVVLAILDRTEFVYRVLQCGETANAAGWLDLAIRTAKGPYKSNRVHILDPGHIYEFGNGKERQLLKFVKSSGDAVTYPKDWDGLQSQTVMSMLTYYLEERRIDNDRVDDPWQWPEECITLAHYEYEARAKRRHDQKVNRRKDAHVVGEGTLEFYGDYGYYPDVPFKPEHVDLLPRGNDGHIRMSHRERLYRSTIDLVQELLP